jgi:DNA-directed RNA polymerase subunit RPC12/RpoP
MTSSPLDTTAPLQEHRFPCTNCGADYRFDPGKDQLICDHCGDISEMENTKVTTPAIRELDFRAALNAQLPEAEIEETRVAKCPNCAAQVEFDADLHATECPFCATPVVTDTGLHRHIKPKGLLPFGLDEPTARKSMTDWLGSLWFAPNGLQEYARKGRALNGIYVPYWTFDADTKSSYRGERGKDYYVSKTVTRNGKTSTVRQRKTRWSPKSGRVARFFDDVLILASRSLPKSLAAYCPFPTLNLQ